jgi:MFS family permease
MAADVTTTQLWPRSTGTASWRALAASWLGWMFDGYETYALVLVMTSAVHQMLSPESLPKASIYIGGLLSVTLLGWAVGGVAAGVLADYLGRRRTLMLSICATPFLQGSPRSAGTTGLYSSSAFLRVWG